MKKPLTTGSKVQIGYGKTEGTVTEVKSATAKIRVANGMGGHYNVWATKGQDGRWTAGLGESVKVL